MKSSPETKNIQPKEVFNYALNGFNRRLNILEKQHEAGLKILNDFVDKQRHTLKEPGAWLREFTQLEDKFKIVRSSKAHPAEEVIFDLSRLQPSEARRGAVTEGSNGVTLFASLREEIELAKRADLSVEEMKGFLNFLEDGYRRIKLILETAEKIPAEE